MKKYLKFLVPICILAVIFSQISFADLLMELQGGDFFLLGVSLLFSFVPLLLQGARWWLLATPFYQGAKLIDYLRINFIAMAMDVFVPGKLGSDAFRIFEAASSQPKSPMVGVLFFLRLQTLVIGGIVASLSLIAWVEGLGALLVALGLSVAAVGILFLRKNSWLVFVKRLLRWALSSRYLPERVRNILEESAGTVVQIVTNVRVQVLSSTTLLFFILSNIYLFWLVALAFDLPVPFLTYFISVPVLLFAATLPITFQGRGVTEAFAIYFWTSEGATTEEVLAVCFSIYVISLLQSMLAAFGFFRINAFKRVKSLDTADSVSDSVAASSSD